MAETYPLRAAVQTSVRRTFGREDEAILERTYGSPTGDPGWFGPRSIAWQVHGDLGPMLVGGLSALFLQTLHPLVMQGVADHSGYRGDPFGRLRRTASFIAGTTYGGEELAQQLVREVRRVHGQVRGTTPDGRTYRASDPFLLTYVHVTEVWSFLRAYQRYSGHPLLVAEKNRYLGEMAVVARNLGAFDVPVTTASVRRYLWEVRPLLAGTDTAREAALYLRKRVGSTLPERAAHAAIVEAAIDLLPPFARAELRMLRPPGYSVTLVRPSATVLAAYLRWALGESPVARAASSRMGVA
ncbi:MAG: oxygenase MpaB family protein [Acidimicrobiales bacterium]